MSVDLNQCLFGDALCVLPSLPDGLAQTVVTSPPYFGLRSYLPDSDPDKRLMSIAAVDGTILT